MTKCDSMSSKCNSSKKYKKPIQNTQATTNPDAPRPRSHGSHEDRSERPEPKPVPLQAKDSEWVDIVQNQPLPPAGPSLLPSSSTSNFGDDEAVLQLVECEDGPESEPLAKMFPGLLEQDPQTFEGMLTKAMSTTEVTKHLVDLGAKANFQYVKKSNRLIPPDRKWLEKVSETDDRNSVCSLDSSRTSSGYPADNEATTEDESSQTKKKLRKKTLTDVASSSVRGSATRTLPSSSSSNGNCTKKK